MTAKEKLDDWICASVLLDEETEDLWNLIEAYVKEEHEARCSDCNPSDAGFCDSCERIDPDNPPERENEGYQ